ncbi:MAG TPA: formylglycine-generating enzyme family protein, partial [Candidatus Hydrogenedentes bacterium]|nr:formylglycine-generating enzyme family protein [Candidatus Hydrogenedentota bacterium]
MRGKWVAGSGVRWAIGFCLVISGGWVALADPVVSNVRASQRTDGSGQVDVYYDLSGAVGTAIVSLAFSNDNGVHWNIAPLQTLLSGDVGAGVANGSNRHIVWDAVRDRPEVLWPQARAKVTAADTGQTLTVTLPGDVLLEMVLIPSGSFTMGSPLDPGWSNTSEAPQHTVTFAQPFYMGKFEVTQAQWWAVMGTAPSQFTGNASLPVEYVSWNDCQAFITKLNTMGKGTFRLPSEAEWEYACRAGTNYTRWHFGNTEAELVNYAWYSTNSANKTHPVGEKLPNAFGLYDMHGNIWEWCQDWHHGNYEGAPTDGTAWEDPAGSYRVLRGGAWGHNSAGCR